MADKDSWRNRRPRKRGFDDDFPSDAGGGGWFPPPSFGGAPAPRQASAFASGPEVDATVKWFNAEKGFGFVELGDGSGDAFLHASVVQRAGATAVTPGTRLKVRIGQGQKGAQVSDIVEIGEMAEAPPPRAPRSGSGGGFAPSSFGEAQEIRGTVKWYNPEKGFGFVAPDTGGKDVFVHATALERSGMPPLTEGQSVLLRVVQGKKGPEATSVSSV